MVMLLLLTFRTSSVCSSSTVSASPNQFSAPHVRPHTWHALWM